MKILPHFYPSTLYLLGLLLFSIDCDIQLMVPFNYLPGNCIVHCIEYTNNFMKNKHPQNFTFVIYKHATLSHFVDL